MTGTDDEVAGPRPAAGAGPVKAYAPPAVSWEEEFDGTANLASACGKAGGGTGEPCESAPAS